MLTWDKPDERYYEHGLDRGVLYIPGKNPVVWNGLTSFDESEGGSSSVLYRDGHIYLSDVDPGDFRGSMNAFFYPREFAECIGIPEATDGMYIDNQKPKRFSFSYRSLIGSGTRGDKFGYQLHLVHNAVASIGTRNRKTLSNSSDMMEFSFDIVCTPVKMTGFRPTAHYIIDTRYLGASTIKQVEDILYGVVGTPGRLPTPNELYDILHFGSAIIFTLSQDGMTFVASGAYDNVHQTSPTQWEILNVVGTDHGNGTYTLEDTP
jgi:hypothetical protein